MHQPFPLNFKMPHLISTVTLTVSKFTNRYSHMRIRLRLFLLSGLLKLYQGCVSVGLGALLEKHLLDNSSFRCSDGVLQRAREHSLRTHSSFTAQYKWLQGSKSQRGWASVWVGSRLLSVGNDKLTSIFMAFITIKASPICTVSPAFTST